MYPIKSPHSVDDNYREKTVLIPAINLPARTYTRISVRTRITVYVRVYSRGREDAWKIWKTRFPGSHNRGYGDHQPGPPLPPKQPGFVQ